MSSEPFRVNGHAFEVVTEFEGDRSVECRHCGAHELVREGDDPRDHLDLMAPDDCKRVVIREADGGFRGIALRNASGFRGRYLEAFDEDGKVTDKIRIYHNDVGKIDRLLDLSQWNRLDAGTGERQHSETATQANSESGQ